MNKYYLFLLLIVLFVSCTSYCTVKQSVKRTIAGSQTDNPEVERYAIYSALINNAYIKDSTNQIVIRDQTYLSTNVTNDLGRTKQVLLGSVLSGLAAQEIFDDFLAKNKQPSDLSSFFNLKTNYVLISSTEERQLFERTDGWKIFYERYPASHGILFLSQPGFNKEKNLALICIGYQSDALSGGGDFVLLAKENDTWIVRRKVTAWAI